jgi:hypothetical protein
MIGLHNLTDDAARMLVRSATRWLAAWLRRVVASTVVQRMRRTDERRAPAQVTLVLVLVLGFLGIAKLGVRDRRLEWVMVAVAVWMVAAWKTRRASYWLLERAAK